MSLSERQIDFAFMLTMMELWARIHYPQYRLVPKEHWRTDEQQVIYFKMGKTKVYHSLHQDGLARDYIVKEFVVDTLITRWNKVHYLWIGEYAEAHGMAWGGRWKNPNDPYHIQYAGKRRKKSERL